MVPENPLIPPHPSSTPHTYAIIHGAMTAVVELGEGGGYSFLGFDPKERKRSWSEPVKAWATLERRVLRHHVDLSRFKNVSAFMAVHPEKECWLEELAKEC